MAKRLLIFDFDGVLSVKWTMPEKPFLQIPNTIKQLSTDHVLAMASFNPRALLAITNWSMDQFFTCARYGSNIPWTGLYKESYRTDMTKADQIVDMLTNEIKNLPHDIIDVIFFDDDPDNIKYVNEKLPYVKTVLIDDTEGFKLTDIPKL